MVRKEKDDSVLKSARAKERQRRSGAEREAAGADDERRRPVAEAVADEVEAGAETRRGAVERRRPVADEAADVAERAGGGGMGGRGGVEWEAAGANDERRRPVADEAKAGAETRRGAVERRGPGAGGGGTGGRGGAAAELSGRRRELMTSGDGRSRRRLRMRRRPVADAKEDGAAPGKGAGGGGRSGAGGGSRRRRDGRPWRRRGGAEREQTPFSPSKWDGLVRPILADRFVPDLGGIFLSRDHPIPLTSQPNTPKSGFIPSHPIPSPQPNTT
uniref:Uncharacterized protein n=1 Tax=Oryza nivara TaxID=4536 RepID=A0A0E0IBV9_ORYNI